MRMLYINERKIQNFQLLKWASLPGTDTLAFFNWISAFQKCFLSFPNLVRGHKSTIALT